MDLLLVFGIFCFLIILFVVSQLVAILWQLKENERLGLLVEQNSPPF